MEVFRGQTLAEFYGELVLLVLKDGELIHPRARECKELRPVALVTMDPVHARLQSQVNYRFGLAEFMAMMCGWDDVPWLVRFNKNVSQFSDDGKVFRGAYGPRVRPQLSRLLEAMQADPDTRQAVLQVWSWQDDLFPTDTKDRPCNTQVYFKVRRNALHMVVMRRSADLIWGVPYDTFVFSNLLCLFAGLLKLGVGHLTEVIDSLHVYTDKAGYYGEQRVMQAIMTPREPAPIPVSWDFDDLPTMWEDFTSARRAVEEGLNLEHVSYITEKLR